MTEYTSVATRDGRWWSVQCDQIPGAISQVRHLSEAAEIHREAIAFVVGVPEESVSVKVRAALPDDVQQRLDSGKQHLTEAAAIEARARADLRSAAIELREGGMSVRDIGWVLGVSHQRAHQLTAAAGAGAKRRAS